ncbi:DsbC/DsbD-like thiol-disulfide interchange protein [Roseibium hamelinense]|uniref:DsbC/DsbD-like thiol-disulfide interchange protein n=1 Tax=Roseibium hamelinense TaxID=150831 RepID=A0A562T2H3_9HYPH|nr:protein-disulfide reductase DsbD domain-containing protein [Roseibium hamelinense]MTI42941.1 hypothetical protein [Roseibium hamelinense]TWI87623.1 DsbC/DsbD-like thiol-disulfide interchange protein [Roseibium hamelinense]
MASLFRYILIAIVTVVSTPAVAVSTDWIEVHGGAVRLIFDGTREGTAYRGGIEFLLEPGWHTYWRNPGEAGIPPQIDGSGSSNLQSLDIRFPVPDIYNDGFSTSVVYHDGIILPLFAVPADAGQPIQLDLSMFFGVCKDICVPGDAEFSLQLEPGMKEDRLGARLIERDLKRVPKSVAMSESPITAIDIVNLDGAPVAHIQTSAPKDGETPDLFAAGPSGSYIGLPLLRAQSADRVSWDLDLTGLKPSESGVAYLDLLWVKNGSGLAVRHILPETSSN